MSDAVPGSLHFAFPIPIMGSQNHMIEGPLKVMEEQSELIFQLPCNNPWEA